MSQAAVLDSVNNPRQPFGLPLGSVRGFLSLLICGFFWIVLLLPDTQPLQALLAHFFMLVLVVLLFSPYSKWDNVSDVGPRTLPWALRVICVGGSIAVVAFVAVKFPERLSTRLTPDPNEVKDWWATYLAVTAGGFSFGQLLRFVLGRQNPIFQTLRAWMSLLAMLLLLGEILFWVAINSAENKPEEFIHIYQAFDLGLIAAYFGTRA